MGRDKWAAEASCTGGWLSALVMEALVMKALGFSRDLDLTTLLSIQVSGHIDLSLYLSNYTYKQFADAIDITI